MGRRADLAKQIEALQAEHDAADDDDDLEIDVEKDGHKVRLRGREARRIMRRLGLDDDPADAKGDDGQGDAEKDTKPDAEPPKRGYFKR